MALASYTYRMLISDRHRNIHYMPRKQHYILQRKNKKIHFNKTDQEMCVYERYILL